MTDIDRGGAESQSREEESDMDRENEAESDTGMKRGEETTGGKFEKGSDRTREAGRKGGQA